MSPPPSTNSNQPPVDQALDEADVQPRSGLHWVTFVLLLLLSMMVITLLYIRDEVVPWDSDLHHVEEVPQMDVPLSAPTRMKTMLSLAAQLVVEREGVPAWDWETPTISRWLDDHGMILDNFRDLLEEKEDEWLPRHLLWLVEDLGADQQAWSNVILLKQAEVFYLARRKEEEYAFRAAVDLAVMASLLERLDTWPSFTERAFEMHEASAQTLAILLSQTQLPADRLQQLQEQEYKPWLPDLLNLADSMKGFYAFERRILMGPAKGEPPLPDAYQLQEVSWLKFKPNATLHLFAESFRDLITACRPEGYALSGQVSHRLFQRLSGVQGIGNPNSSGERYFATRIHRYADFPERLNLALARHRIVMSLFAIRRFVATEFRVPQTWEELVPAYLPDIPMDPFNSEALKLSADKGIIYSVGMDLKDDGGRIGALPLADAYELTAEIGIKVAKSAP